MKQQSTSKGFTILSISSIVCKLLSLLYLPFQAMIVGDLGNGYISQGYRIYILLFSLSNAGLPTAISKLIADSDEIGDYRSSQKIFRIATYILLGMGVAFGLFMLLGYKLILAYLGLHSDGRFMIMAFAPTFLFTAIECAYRGYFQGKKNMTPTAVSQVVEQVLNAAFTVIFEAALIGFGVASAAAGATVGTTVGAAGSAAYLAYLYRKGRRQRMHELRHTKYEGPQRSTKEILTVILMFMLPQLLNSVSTLLADVIDAGFCTQRLQAGGYSYVDAMKLFGVYSVQFQRVNTLALALPVALCTAIVPAISSAWAARDNKLLRRKIRESYKSFFMFTVPSVAGLTFLAHPIVTMIFAHNDRGYDLLYKGAWLALLMAINYVQTAILIALNKPHIAPINTIIAMIVKFLFNYYLIPIKSINIFGAILGTGAAWLIAAGLNQYFIIKNVPGELKCFRYLIRPTLASLVMGGGCLLVYNLFMWFLGLFLHAHQTVIKSDIALLISIAFGVAVYGVMMIVIKGIKAKDIERLPMGGKILRRLMRYSLLSRYLQQS